MKTLKQKTLGLLVIFTLLFFAGDQMLLFAAGQVNITTYYDKPDGDFKELDVTGNSSFGADNNSVVTLATGGGTTAIGTTTPAQQSLTVKNTLNPMTASFMKSDGYGVLIGAANGSSYGAVLGKTPGGGEAPLYLNPGGGIVNIGGAAASASMYQLYIGGTLGITQGSNTGEVKVAWAGDGYYATYAP